MLKSFGKGMFGCFGVFVGFIILCILGFAFLGAGSSGSDSTSNNAKTESNSKDNTPQEYKSALNKLNYILILCICLKQEFMIN